MSVSRGRIVKIGPSAQRSAVIGPRPCRHALFSSAYPYDLHPIGSARPPSSWHGATRGAHRNCAHACAANPADVDCLAGMLSRVEGCRGRLREAAFAWQLRDYGAARLLYG